MAGRVDVKTYCVGTVEGWEDYVGFQYQFGNGENAFFQAEGSVQRIYSSL